MGETLDETRLEIVAQRAEIEATVARMREALDIRRRFRENPALVVGLGAAAVFMVVGGPRRVFGAVRRHLSPTTAEKAYDALPEPMQAWVAMLAESAGPKATEVRDALVEELRRWRRDPVKDRKAREALARQMVEGPPGPTRTAWKAAEAALTLVAAALARQAIARFLTDGPDKKEPTTASSQAAATSSPAGEQAYSGFSSIKERVP
ncbi:MAG: hypothetical protein E6J47_03830 [Chloroflexi bacterium]|nr:MAG: hypothetical protein E6J47_03830 [Chloroflexota bacterium]